MSQDTADVLLEKALRGAESACFFFFFFFFLSLPLLLTMNPQTRCDVVEEPGLVQILAPQLLNSVIWGSPSLPCKMGL